MTGDVLPAPDDIATKCSPENIEADGPDACEEICDPATCWSAPGDENCFADNPVSCLGYIPCANLLFSGGELEDPPGDLATKCNFANVLAYEACSECKCECEKAACCIGEGDDNCFDDGNAPACTAWIAGCAILSLGSCQDWVCDEYNAKEMKMSAQGVGPSVVQTLASETFNGRENDTPGSLAAQQYLLTNSMISQSVLILHLPAARPFVSPLPRERIFSA